jgi:hypothetical protein
VGGSTQLPSLVIERADLVRGEADLVDERGEQELRLEAFALVADGAGIEGRGRRWVLAARLAADLELDKLVALSAI